MSAAGASLPLSLLDDIPVKHQFIKTQLNADNLNASLTPCVPQTVPYTLRQQARLLAFVKPVSLSAWRPDLSASCS